jgi:hypothetical protein
MAKLGGLCRTETLRRGPSTDAGSAASHEKDSELDFWLLASMIVGGMFGAWLLNSWLGGGVWGILAGAFTFACFRPWPTSNPNSDGDSKAPGEGPQISWQGADRSPAKKVG